LCMGGKHWAGFGLGEGAAVLRKYLSWFAQGFVGLSAKTRAVAHF
jgi:hypothetical protein